MSGRDRFQQDTRYDVPLKKGKGNRHHYHEKEKDLGVKFFVSNLPERCASSDLIRVLKDFGDIQGTYIARKYDRLGKRFGFVTFNRGRNMDDLESALKDVWIGSYKLFIVRARFVDGKEIPRKEEKVGQPVKGKEVQEEGKEEASEKSSVPVDVSMEDRRSFKDTLLNKEAMSSDMLEITVDPSVAAFGNWYDRAIVVHLRNLKALTTLRSWLKSMCEDEVEIKYVGGLCAILVFANRDIKNEFTSKKDAWGVYVDLVEEWYGQTFKVPRIAWIKIRGVPLSLSCSKVFDEVASNFGSVVQSAMFPEEDGDLSVACVGILRSESDRVNQKVRLKWKSSKFEVLVEEEMADWIPDCLVELEEEGLEAEEIPPEVNIVAEEMFDLNVAHADSPVNIGVEGSEHAGIGNGEQTQKGEQSTAIKKRKGFCRKNGSRNKSASPVGNDRPKKRQREGEDLFELDQFIYTVNEGQIALEKETGSGSNGNVNEEVIVGNNVVMDINDLGSSFGMGENCDVNKERDDTVLMAKSLGVKNMDRFSDELAQVIVNEGFQGVDQ